VIYFTKNKAWWCMVLHDAAASSDFLRLNAVPISAAAVVSAPQVTSCLTQKEIFSRWSSFVLRDIQFTLRAACVRHHSLWGLWQCTNLISGRQTSVVSNDRIPVSASGGTLPDLRRPNLSQLRSSPLETNRGGQNKTWCVGPTYIAGGHMCCVLAWKHVCTFVWLVWLLLTFSMPVSFS
jgi:hypothetical protein